MGFLSSLFGVKDRTPATTTNVVSTKLPEELSPFVKEVLGEAQDLYKGEIERGYDPYTGQTIAPLTAEEQQAMAGIAGLAGTTTPLLQEGLQTYRQGAEKFTGDTAQQYMSPYQQAVTDIEKREAQRNFEGNILPRLEAQAVQQGAMSGLGSRAGVEMAEAQRNQAQLLADIQAKGQQKAFQDARQGFEQQKARETTMAGNVARTGPALFQAGLAEQGALQTVGEQKRQLGQSALDEAYAKFLEEKNFPRQTLADYSSTIYGSAPSFSTGAKSTTGTSLPGAPSTGQQLLGLGLSGLNIFGAGTAGGTKDFSFGRAFAPRAEGGQVGEELPVINRRIGGPLDNADALAMLQEYYNVNSNTGKKEKEDFSFLEGAKEAAPLYRDAALQNVEKVRGVLEGLVSSRDTLMKNQQADKDTLSSESFGKREEEIKRRREKYPFAAIQKAISAGMQQPTIATMFTEGLAVGGAELENKADELDALTDALEKEKFGTKSKEMSDKHQANIDKLKSNAEIQIRMLGLDKSTQLEILKQMLAGVQVETLLENALTAKAKAKGNKFKLDKTVKDTGREMAIDVLGLKSEYDAAGNLKIIGQNKQDGTQITEQDGKDLQQLNQDFLFAYGTYQNEGGNPAINSARAMAYAKERHLKRKSKLTSSSSQFKPDSQINQGSPTNSSNVTGVPIIPEDTLTTQ